MEKNDYRSYVYRFALTCVTRPGGECAPVNWLITRTCLRTGAHWCMRGTRMRSAVKVWWPLKKFCVFTLLLYGPHRSVAPFPLRAPDSGVWGIPVISIIVTARFIYVQLLAGPALFCSSNVVLFYPVTNRKQGWSHSKGMFGGRKT